MGVNIVSLNFMIANDIFEVKLTIEMLTVCGQQHSFSTHERVFLWKCKSFLETENVWTWGGLEPPTFGFMPNALTIWAIRARHLLSHVFEHWLWRYRYFLSKVWNVNCARATVFIFDTRTVVLVKVSKFFRDLRGTQTPNLRIHAECSYSILWLQMIDMWKYLILFGSN